MDTIDADPDILRRAETPPPSVPPLPSPEMEALQQMLNETINRLLAALAENVLLRRRIMSGG
jgi:hypothetical protein